MTSPIVMDMCSVIDYINDTFIELYSCGWFTKTTKARLNAILQEHGNGDYIFQKKGEWFVNTNSQVVSFVEGMILK